MPTFTYTARNEQGLVQTGALDAMNEDEVIATLQHRGLLVTSLNQKDMATALKPLAIARNRRMHGRVTTQDHVLLCQQLATLVEAGVPLLKALEVVTSQVESRKLHLALEEIQREVSAGKTFREALAKHPAIFSPLWLNLVETGEASGHLSDALNQLAHHFELSEHLQTETQTALTYPAFLMAASIGVLALFVYWLIPKFSVIFKSLGNMELPLITRMMIGVSDLARKYVLVVVAAVMAAVYLVRGYLQTTAGQWTRDRLLLSLPVFKEFMAYVQLAEFSQGLSTLLKNGVPLLSSLEILERSATNKLYGRAIGRIREAVKEGKPMAQPMADVGLFPPMTVQMVRIGEEVGELAKMVAQMARYYGGRVEVFIARMTRLFEPIAILVMGGLVLIIVLSIFMPIFKMATGMQAG